MDQAVSEAFEYGSMGDAVLLSPACSSFDMFIDYAQRGQMFADAVRRLGNGGEKN
jgi:UDP-N-acetylmuramoylalanine--D-glutamate ligase